MAVTPTVRPTERTYRITVLNRTGKMVRETLCEGVNHEAYAINENHCVFILTGKNKEQLVRFSYPYDWVVICEPFEPVRAKPKPIKAVPVEAEATP